MGHAEYMSWYILSTCHGTYWVHTMVHTEYIAWYILSTCHGTDWVYGMIHTEYMLWLSSYTVCNQYHWLTHYPLPIQQEVDGQEVVFTIKVNMYIWSDDTALWNKLEESLRAVHCELSAVDYIHMNKLSCFIRFSENTLEAIEALKSIEFKM